MFAIAFDLVVEATEKNHPRGVSQAHQDIGRELSKFKFERVQGSVYLTTTDDLANLFAAILALRALQWLPPSIRDIWAFKVEHWSDFTALVKAGA